MNSSIIRDLGKASTETKGGDAAPFENNNLDPDHV